MFDPNAALGSFKNPLPLSTPSSLTSSKEEQKDVFQVVPPYTPGTAQLYPLNRIPLPAPGVYVFPEPRPHESPKPSPEHQPPISLFYDPRGFMPLRGPPTHLNPPDTLPSRPPSLLHPPPSSPTLRRGIRCALDPDYIPEFYPNIRGSHRLQEDIHNVGQESRTKYLHCSQYSRYASPPQWRESDTALDHQHNTQSPERIIKYGRDFRHVRPASGNANSTETHSPWHNSPGRTTSVGLRSSVSGDRSLMSGALQDCELPASRRENHEPPNLRIKAKKAASPERQLPFPSQHLWRRPSVYDDATSLESKSSGRPGRDLKLHLRAGEFANRTESSEASLSDVYSLCEVCRRRPEWIGYGGIWFCKRCFEDSVDAARQFGA